MEPPDGEPLFIIVGAVTSLTGFTAGYLDMAGHSRIS